MHAAPTPRRLVAPCLALLLALSCLLAFRGQARGDEPAGPSPAPRLASPLSHSTQAVVVVSPSWRSVQATMMCFERPSPDGTWQAVGAPAAVVVGRSGMAWGRGRHPGAGLSGPRKREGDGCAPAGVFDIPEAFGFASSVEARAFIRMPYRAIKVDTDCVDDARSSRYNRIVDRPAAGERDYKSAEAMQTISLYRWGAFVAHNTEGTLPGGGSCIFLHIWKNAHSGTAGCTAMPESTLKRVLGWMRPEAHPVLVAAPRAEYTRLQSAWGLPRIGRSR